MATADSLAVELARQAAPAAALGTRDNRRLLRGVRKIRGHVDRLSAARAAERLARHFWSWMDNSGTIRTRQGCHSTALLLPERKTAIFAEHAAPARAGSRGRPRIAASADNGVPQ